MHISSDAIIKAARGKLLAFDVPVLLRVAGFIRLSCRALERDHGYAQVLQDLSEFDSEWWKSCDIRPDGCLFCWDPVIHELLVPLFAVASCNHGCPATPAAAALTPQAVMLALTGIRGG
jgi:hypothetical protein